MFFTRRALTVQLALSLCLGCSGQASPAKPSQSPDAVRLVEQAEFDAMRESGKWTFSEPRGDVGASEACTSGSVDDQCVAAARERLKAAAAERGANLVLVRPGAMLQSYPPQYALNGVLYDIRPRS
jgi:hypothetical protein